MIDFRFIVEKIYFFKRDKIELDFGFDVMEFLIVIVYLKIYFLFLG